jgi:pyrroloquinoline quinone biosynthesis protein B
VSADSLYWYVINASPDIRQQITAFEGLSPRAIPRDTPMQAILLTNAELDHIAGLLSLRESQPLCFYSTQQVRDWVLELNVVFRAVCPPSSSRTWKIVSTAGEHPLIGADEKDSGLRYAAFPVPAKPPAYLADVVSPENESTIGYKIIDTQSNRSLAYVPAIKYIDDTVAAILDGCDCFFFDGTCWSDDELMQQGLAQKTSLSMGHIPISGPEGSLTKLASLRTVRKIYTHLNNTNPLLNEDSPERRMVEEAGWEVAFDGMDFEV